MVSHYCEIIFSTCPLSKVSVFLTFFEYILVCARVCVHVRVFMFMCVYVCLPGLLAYCVDLQHFVGINGGFLFTDLCVYTISAGLELKSYKGQGEGFL